MTNDDRDPVTGAKRSRNAQLLADHFAGMTRAALASKYDISPERVRQIIMAESFIRGHSLSWQER